MAVKSLAQSSILQPSGVNSLLGDYEGNYFHHLETVRLGGSAASVTFSNLAQYSDYQHLQIRMLARSSRADTDSQIGLTFNDATSTYYVHQLIGTGSSVVSQSQTGVPYINAYSVPPGSTATSGAFGAAVIDLLDPFEVNKNKVIRELGGVNTASFSRVFLNSGAWFTSTAVTTIKLQDLYGSFVSGSRFSLYGIKARS
jgi:hypothetical protein